MSRLLQLSLLRQSVAGRERYPLIIWLTCHVDLYALLSGASEGAYVRAAIESHLLPETELLLYPVGLQNSSAMYPEEYDPRPLIMRLYRKCFILSARFGLFIAGVRASKMAHTGPVFRELENTRAAFKHLWNSDETQLFIESQSNLPRLSQHCFYQVGIRILTSRCQKCEAKVLGYPAIHTLSYVTSFHLHKFRSNRD